MESSLYRHVQHLLIYLKYIYRCRRRVVVRQIRTSPIIPCHYLLLVAALKMSVREQFSWVPSQPSMSSMCSLTIYFSRYHHWIIATCPRNAVCLLIIASINVFDVSTLATTFAFETISVHGSFLIMRKKHISAAFSLFGIVWLFVHISHSSGSKSL